MNFFNKMQLVKMIGEKEPIRITPFEHEGLREARKLKEPFHVVRLGIEITPSSISTIRSDENIIYYLPKLDKETEIYDYIKVRANIVSRITGPEEIYEMEDPHNTGRWFEMDKKFVPDLVTEVQKEDTEYMTLEDSKKLGRKMFDEIIKKNGATETKRLDGIDGSESPSRPKIELGK